MTKAPPASMGSANHSVLAMCWSGSIVAGLAAVLCAAVGARAQEATDTKPLWIEGKFGSLGEPIANDSPPPDLWERVRVGTSDFFERTGSDFDNFYASENILFVGASVALMAPVANGYADRRMRDWYQRQAGPGRSHWADETANIFYILGDHRLTIPIYLTISFTEHFLPNNPYVATLSEFGQRSLRALAVGAPTVGILQGGLGSTRPERGDSRWRPFRGSNGASGHAFVGAVPFLTAASMTDSYLLKSLLIAGSLGTGWSRIHHDAHYTSQVILGWSVAVIAVRAVNLTEWETGRIKLVPAEVGDGAGIGVQIDY